MANGLNRVTLIGNLGADPELKYTQGGQALLKMSLATTETYVDKSGERKEKTEWHRITMWGKRAEALNKFLGKGHTLCAEGRIQYRSWEDQEGNKRYSTDIVANNIVLLGGGRGRNSESSNYGSPEPAGESFPPPDQFGDDDIPF